MYVYVRVNALYMYIKTYMRVCRNPLVVCVCTHRNDVCRGQGIFNIS